MAHALDPSALSGVSETALLTLYARAWAAQQRPPMLDDPRAQRICEQLGVDPARFHQAQNAETTLRLTATRVRLFDRHLRAWLGKNPGGTVVELGAGFDTRMMRVDDGLLSWFDLDLPQEVALRRPLIPPGDRSRLLAHDAFDVAWLDAIPRDRPVFVAIEGVLIYFPEDQNLALIDRICAALPPGSAVAFDSLGQFYHRAQAKNGVMRGVHSRFQWELEEPRDRRWPWPLAASDSVAEEATRHPAIPAIFRWIFWIGLRLQNIRSWRVNVLTNAAELAPR